MFIYLPLADRIKLANIIKEELDKEIPATLSKLLTVEAIHFYCFLMSLNRLDKKKSKRDN
jgi:hypothetical protein